MTIPSITPDPINPPANPPTRDDPDNFRTRADAFVDWQAEDFPDEIDGFITEANAMADAMNTTASDIDATAVIVAADSFTAQQAANVALNAANFLGEWSALSGSADVPSSVYYDGYFWALLEDISDITAEEPGVSAKWQVIWTNALHRKDRTSNTAITVNDHSTIINITSGTFTQTIASIATLADGWFCYVRNQGTGVVTIDPDGTETIDGVLTATVESGDTFLLQSFGGALKCYKVEGVKDHYFTATNASWAVPAGVHSLFVQVWGGGGSGSTHEAGGPGNGGGGGGYSEGTISVTPGTVKSITVGAGGIAHTGASTSGATGGTSSFSSDISATGGSGGTTLIGGAGGVGTGGELNITGGFGGKTNLVALSGQGGGTHMTPSTTSPDGAYQPAGFEGNFPGGGASGALYDQTTKVGGYGLVKVRY